MYIEIQLQHHTEKHQAAIIIMCFKSAVSILRIDTAELHRVYDNMLQRAQKCIDVQGGHLQHLL
jgi:hypothetical protein